MPRLRQGRALAEGEDRRASALRGDAAALLVALAVTLVAFGGVASNEFLNWDDRAALVDNPALDGEGVLGWAFTTTHMSHYQPLSWLAWALARRWFGAGATVHHVLSLALHLVNVVLVFVLGHRLASAAGLAAEPRRVAALAASLSFAVHPLRVEPVAWASGLPYVLALAPLLASTLLYLRHAAGSPSPVALGFSIFFYGLSLLSRAFSPALAFVLLALDFSLGRVQRGGWTRLGIEKLPYAALAVVATMAEGGARRFAPLERVGVSERASEAALAPFVYILRTLWPLGLSPLDPLSLERGQYLPSLLVGVALLIVVSAAVWRWRREHPWLLVGWLAYLLLLGPALGLLPSGLQATADRYTYLPGVTLALGIGGGAARLWADRPRRRGWAIVGVALAAVLVGLTLRQVRFWKDSVTLWTHALALDARNDVALYNLAHALAEKGDAAGAETQYRRLLELVPDHELGRRNLALLEAARFEREGNDRAAAGRLPEAIELYGRALERDAARLHSRRSRGMALAQLGRYADAIPDLREAARAPDAEPVVAGALAFVLAESGRSGEAADVLRDALGRHPGDPRLSRALAELERRPPE
ncbi:MAG TPA: tetratricopeptide repeat protein [Vicinamibacteria bacterium]|nr:tetratricopeptide repeat protein [Vicinamibacteria bacterium]